MLQPFSTTFLNAKAIAASFHVYCRRLEQQVVSSRLWEPACQALQPPLPAAVPATFGSLQQYVAAFEPLMLEEAAEGIKAAFEESERAGRGADVEVQM